MFAARRNCREVVEVLKTAGAYVNDVDEVRELLTCYHYHLVEVDMTLLCYFIVCEYRIEEQLSCGQLAIIMRVQYLDY